MTQEEFCDCRRAHVPIGRDLPGDRRLQLHAVRNGTIVDTLFTRASAEIARFHESNADAAILVDCNAVGVDAAQVAAVGGTPGEFPYAVAMAITPRTGSRLPSAALDSASLWVVEAMVSVWRAHSYLRIRNGESVFTVCFPSNFADAPRDTIAIALNRIRRAALDALTRSETLGGEFVVSPTAAFPSPRSTSEIMNYSEASTIAA